MLEFRTKMPEDGRIVVPAACRKALKLEPGSDLIIRVDGEEIRIFSVSQAIKHVRNIVSKYIKSDDSLVDELLKMRKEEAKNE